VEFGEEIAVNPVTVSMPLFYFRLHSRTDGKMDAFAHASGIVAVLCFS
jgi:hypothetical protein